MTSGCANQKPNEDPDSSLPEDYVPSDVKRLYEEQTRNINAINEITSLIRNTSSSNYSFSYDITIKDNNYTYTGEKYYNVVRGIYNNDISYQLENDKFYNPDTKEEIANLYPKIDSTLIDLSTYANISHEKYTCIKTDNLGLCESIDRTKTLTFNFNENYLTNLIYNNEDKRYSLSYSNFDNIEYIPFIHDTITNPEYDKTDKIEKIEVTENVDAPYTVYNYYITNATVTINGETMDVFDTAEVFNTPISYKEYSDIKDTSIKSIEEFIYENDFLIIIVHPNAGNTIYYLSTTEYKDEILNKYINN